MQSPLDNNEEARADYEIERDSQMVMVGEYIKSIGKLCRNKPLNHYMIDWAVKHYQVHNTIDEDYIPSKELETYKANLRFLKKVIEEHKPVGLW